MYYKSLATIGVMGIAGVLFANRPIPVIQIDSDGCPRLYNRGHSNLEYKSLDGIYVELPPSNSRNNYIWLPADSELVKKNKDSYEIRYKNIFGLPITKIIYTDK